LLELCADHVAADFPLVPDDLDWAVATQARFEAAYEMWAEHADLVLLMRGRPWQGENIMMRFYEPCMQTLLGAGMSIHRAAKLFSVLHRMTIGSVVLTRANDWHPWQASEALRRIGEQRFPALVRVQSEVEWADLDSIYRDTLRRLILDLGPAS